jgi:hypothetical protein
MTAIDGFFDHYYGRRPVNATFTGVHGYDDQLPDWSLDGLAAMDDEMRSLGDQLAAEYPAPASASASAFRSSPDLLDAELARGFLEIQRAENASLHGPRGNPSLWTGEAIFSIIALMIRDFAPVEERIARAEARLGRIRDFLRDRSAKMTLIIDEPGVAVGFAPVIGPDEPNGTLDWRRPIPKAWADKARRECEGAIVLLTEGIERWSAAAKLGNKDAFRLHDAAADARTAFRMFATRLGLHPAAPDEAMACGPDFYDLLLARGHQCARSRADLLVEANERFAAERARLDAMARDVAGSWDNVQEQLAAAHPTPDEYFGAFGETWNACRARALEANAVSWPDDWPIRYVPYPGWTADAAPYLYYLHYRSPAPFDPYTTHDYVVPRLPADGADLERHLRVWNHSTIKLNHVVHHGAVGHHVQNWHAYHQQRSRIGKVAGVDCASRIGMFCGGTMTEGWACYATQLMEELGFLTPLERVAEQHSRVRFLARAIVDIELHQGTMSFAEATRFYAEQVGMSADAARGEVVKSSMFPCTALMYWLGTQSILDLRDEMKRREGPRFSLLRFHGELLGFGAVPVPLVARIMTKPAPLPG